MVLFVVFISILFCCCAAQDPSNSSQALFGITCDYGGFPDDPEFFYTPCFFSDLGLQTVTASTNLTGGEKTIFFSCKFETPYTICGLHSPYVPPLGGNTVWYDSTWPATIRTDVKCPPSSDPKFPNKVSCITGTNPNLGECCDPVTNAFWPVSLEL